MSVLQRRYRDPSPSSLPITKALPSPSSFSRNGTFERGEKCNFRQDSTRFAILPGENEDLMSDWLEGRYSRRRMMQTSMSKLGISFGYEICSGRMGEHLLLNLGKEILLVFRFFGWEIFA
jgi:hypothetical protein